MGVGVQIPLSASAAFPASRRVQGPRQDGLVPEGPASDTATRCGQWLPVVRDPGHPQAGVEGCHPSAGDQGAGGGACEQQPVDGRPRLAPSWGCRLRQVAGEGGPGGPGMRGRECLDEGVEAWKEAAGPHAAPHRPDAWGATGRPRQMAEEHGAAGQVSCHLGAPSSPAPPPGKQKTQRMRVLSELRLLLKAPTPHTRSCICPGPPGSRAPSAAHRPGTPVPPHPHPVPLRFLSVWL